MLLGFYPVIYIYRCFFNYVCFGPECEKKLKINKKTQRNREEIVCLKCTQRHVAQKPCDFFNHETQGCERGR